MQPRPIKHDKNKCIVPGCHSTRRAKHHVFPKDEVQGRLWVEAVSSPHLNDLTYKQIYDFGYRVCHLHFSKDDYVCGPRNVFRKKPIPSLLLPIKNVTDVPAEEIDKEASIDLDHERQNEDPSTPSRAINCIPNVEFSPIAYRNCLSKSPENVNSWRSEMYEEVLRARKEVDNYRTKNKSADGTLWEPNKRFRLCSRHFIGNTKPDHPLSPNTVPTISPSKYYEQSSHSKKYLQESKDRFDRAQNRLVKKLEVSRHVGEGNSQNVPNNSTVPEIQTICASLEKPLIIPAPINCHDQAVQVYFPEESFDLAIFICNRVYNNDSYEAETQAKIPLTLSHKNHAAVKKNILDKCCGNDEDSIDRAVFSFNPTIKEELKIEIKEELL